MEVTLVDQRNFHTFLPLLYEVATACAGPTFCSTPMHNGGGDIAAALEWRTMDGIHDLGGFQGFGLVEVEVDEPLFHSEWERRVFRLAMGAMLSGHLGGKLRHAVERIDPETYLTSSYY